MKLPEKKAEKIKFLHLVNEKEVYINIMFSIIHYYVIFSSNQNDPIIYSEFVYFQLFRKLTILSLIITDLEFFSDITQIKRFKACTIKISIFSPETNNEEQFSKQ